MPSPESKIDWAPYVDLGVVSEFPRGWEGPIKGKMLFLRRCSQGPTVGTGSTCWRPGSTAAEARRPFATLGSTILVCRGRRARGLQVQRCMPKFCKASISRKSSWIPQGKQNVVCTCMSDARNGLEGRILGSSYVQAVKYPHKSRQARAQCTFISRRGGPPRQHVANH